MGGYYNVLAAIYLQRLFQDNEQLFHLAWETEWGNKHYLFSHAGITDKYACLDCRAALDDILMPCPVTLGKILVL